MPQTLLVTEAWGHQEQAAGIIEEVEELLDEGNRIFGYEMRGIWQRYSEQIREICR